MSSENRLRGSWLAAVITILSFAVSAAAERPPRPADGFGVFVIVFLEPHTAPQTKLDVTQFGGIEHEERTGALVATLPLTQWATVESLPEVAYVQRLWMGESQERWNEGRAAKRAPELTTLSGSASVQAASWESGVYAYDGSGNITAVGNDRYAYDSAGRLIQATVGGVVETYGYDSFGNLITKSTGGNASPIPPVSRTSNQLTGYPYDEAGNVTSLPAAGKPWEVAATYEYDALGMPAFMSSHVSGERAERMIYTADDERVARMEGRGSGPGPIWLRGFDGKVLREYRGNFTSSDWIWIEDYIWADGRVVAAEREEWNGGRVHFHLDHLGSTRLITRDDKVMISAHRYYPFGVEQTQSTYEIRNYDINPLRIEPVKFTGHQRDFNGLLNDEGTDYLDYMHARYYDPNMGRFLSVDPGRDWDVAAPQSWNLYSYVRNVPILKTDPTGRRNKDAVRRVDIANNGCGCSGGRQASMTNARPPVVLMSPMELVNRYAVIRANVGGELADDEGTIAGTTLEVDVKDPGGRDAALNIAAGGLFSLRVTADADGLNASGAFLGVPFGDRNSTASDGSSIAGTRVANIGYTVTDEAATVTGGNKSAGVTVGAHATLFEHIKQDITNYIAKHMRDSAEFNQQNTSSQDDR